MGQYYRPVILGNRNAIRGYFYSHHYGNGLKLMEHSYLDNNFVGAVMQYLNENGGARLVWAGDYADNEKGKDENLYSLTSSLEDNDGKVIRKEKPEIIVEEKCDQSKLHLIINDDKKEFIDLWYIKGLDTYPIHPLPLLTAEGNNRGGGDYSGTNMALVGTWARDFIRVEGGDWSARNNLMQNGYKEINPLFVENSTIFSATETLLTAIRDLREHGHFSDDDIAPIQKALKDIKRTYPED